jgi:hypothetical protein
MISKRRMLKVSCALDVGVCPFGILHEHLFHGPFFHEALCGMVMSYIQKFNGSKHL